MRPDIHLSDTWSFRGGRDTLERKGLLEELPAIAEAYDTRGGGNQNLSGRREVLAPLDWQQEVSVEYEAETADGSISRRADFDAYKNGVAVEHERGEQMRANWHLMKIEAAYRDPSSFPGDRSVEAGALLIPEDVNFPTLERTQTDVQAFLSNYFGFSVPLFVWQYPADDRAL
jgi:hypothetical protein